MGRFTASVTMRPIRVGFVAGALDRAALQTAMTLAARAWGGVHFPVLEADSPELVPTAERLGIDIFHPLDDCEASLRAAKLPGFWWRPSSTGDPFTRQGTSAVNGLLPPERLPAQDRTPDTVADLLAGIEPEPGLSEAVRSTSRHVLGWPSDRYCALTVCPDPVPDGLLVDLWNLRACGVHVIVLQAGEPLDAIAGQIPARVAGGEPLWLIGDVPDALQEDLARRQIPVLLGAALREARADAQHRLSTGFTHVVSGLYQRREAGLDVAVPRLPLPSDGEPFQGKVAVEIDFYEVSGAPAGTTFSLPHIRALAPNLIDPTFTSYSRTGLGGTRVVTAHADRVQVQVPALRLTRVLTDLLPGSEVATSPQGKIDTQLFERFSRIGAPGLLGEPAARAVITEASRASGPLPLQRLLRKAVDHKGRHWSDGLRTTDEQEYARQVVRALIAADALAPVLPLACPSCGIDTAWAPEDIDRDLGCPICGHTRNTGLALTAKRPPPQWQFSMPDWLRGGRLTASAPSLGFAAWLQNHVAAMEAVPCLFGAETRATKSFEVDVVAWLGSPTTIVLAEAKSGEQALEESDLTNLERGAEAVRSRGIRCMTAFATTRSHLTSDEQSLLAGRYGGNRTSPILVPLIVVGDDMAHPAMTFPLRDALRHGHDRYTGLAAYQFARHVVGRE